MGVAFLDRNSKKEITSFGDGSLPEITLASMFFRPWWVRFTEQKNKTKKKLIEEVKRRNAYKVNKTRQEIKQRLTTDTNTGNVVILSKVEEIWNGQTCTYSLKPLRAHDDFTSLIQQFGKLPSKFQRHLLINEDDGKLDDGGWISPRWQSDSEEELVQRTPEEEDEIIF